MKSFIYIILIGIFIISCSKDEVALQITIDDLLGNWTITSFEDEHGASSAYEGFIFEYKENGIIEVRNSSEIEEIGSYALINLDINGTASSIIDLILDSGNLSDLKEEWVLTARNSDASRLTFIEKESNQSPETFTMVKE